MVERATDKPGKHRACKCGARTPKEHTDAILGGYPFHTWSGTPQRAK